MSNPRKAPSEHIEVLNILADGVPRRTRDIYPLTTEIADVTALSKIINYLATKKFWIVPSKDDSKAYQLTELGQEALDAYHGKQAPQKQTELAKCAFDEQSAKNTLDAIPGLEIPAAAIAAVEKMINAETGDNDKLEIVEPPMPSNISRPSIGDIESAAIDIVFMLRNLKNNAQTIKDKDLKIAVLTQLAELMNGDIAITIRAVISDIEMIPEAE